MKLRKMITVSAAALMLAGVGASATNSGAPVHASRRTVRISRLEANKGALNHQIRLDKKQVRRLNREITQLSRKHIRKGKRSKKTVKRHKRAKKQSKKNANKPTAKPIKVVKHGKIDKQAGTYHMQKNGSVYTFNVTSKGLPIANTEKRVMSLKSYNKKYTPAIQKQTGMFDQLLKAYQQNPKANAKYVSVLMQLRSSVMHMMPYKNI